MASHEGGVGSSTSPRAHRGRTDTSTRASQGTLPFRIDTRRGLPVRSTSTHSEVDDYPFDFRDVNVQQHTRDTSTKALHNVCEAGFPSRQLFGEFDSLALPEWVRSSSSTTASAW